MTSAPGEYSADERATLLALAHRAIQAKLDSQSLDTTAPSDHLAELRGAFTTLHLEGELRGCVGYVVPMYPLYRTIAETAVAAAFGDPRFSPVTPEEAGHLVIEISVLSLMFPIQPEEVEVGKHGLLISRGTRRGLLLPQVPLEQGWDRLSFLEQTCYKAGLPPLAWKEGAQIEAFTAEVFGESHFATPACP
jgi:AmmeMemoRadiSam system protein A